MVKQALKAGISTPRLLTQAQCLDGVKACTRQMKVLKGQARGLQQVHLRDCLIWAKDAGNKIQCTGIRMINQEENKSIWRKINRAIDNASLGAVPFIQRMEQGEVIDIYDVCVCVCVSWPPVTRGGAVTRAIPIASNPPQ